MHDGNRNEEQNWSLVAYHCGGRGDGQGRDHYDNDRSDHSGPGLGAERRLSDMHDTLISNSIVDYHA